MTEGQVLDLARDAVYTIIVSSAPLLLISLAVGLIVSIIQTVTSIRTFVPKILAVFAGLLLFGSWILKNLTTLIETLWSNFSLYLGG